MDGFIIQHPGGRRGGLLFAGMGNDDGVDKPVWSPSMVRVFETEDAAREVKATLEKASGRFGKLARESEVVPFDGQGESVDEV